MIYKYRIVDENGNQVYFSGEEDLQLRVSGGGVVHLFSKVPLQLKRSNRNKYDNLLTTDTVIEDLGNPPEFPGKVSVMENEIELANTKIEEIMKNHMPNLLRDSIDSYLPITKDPDEVLENDTIEFNLNGETKTGRAYKLFDNGESQEIAVEMEGGSKVVIPAEDFVKVVKRGSL